jgi:cysteine desulfurase
MAEEIVYLDNNATTQIDERVLAEMIPFFTQHYGNPSSKYYPQAEMAKKAVETSRIQCAKLVKCSEFADEIIKNM